MKPFLVAIAMSVVCLCACDGATSSKGASPGPTPATVLDESRSTLTASTGPLIADGAHPATVTAKLVRSDGAALANVAVDLRAEGQDAPFASGKSDSAGVFSAPFATAVAGHYTFEAVVHLDSGPTPLNATATAEWIAGPAATLVFTGAPGTATAGGYLAPVSVSITDAQGNVVTTDTRAVTLRDADTNGLLLGGTTQTAVSGVARFPDVSLTQAGSHQLIAHTDGLPDVTSPAFQIVAAPPSDATSSLTVSQTLARADGASPITVSARYRDGYGNPCAGLLVRFDLSGVGNTVEPAGPWLLTDDNGALDIVVTSTRAEFKSIFLSTEGLIFDQQISFQAGPADAAHSSLTTSSPNTVGGATPATITLTLGDAFGNAVPFGWYSMTIGGSGNSITSTSGQTDANGVAHVRVSSTVAEVKPVTASSGFTLTQTLAFGPGAPAQLRILSQPWGGITLEPLARAAVAVEDAYGNPETSLSEGTVTASLTGPMTATLGGAPIQPIVNGVATFDDLTVDRAVIYPTLSFQTGNITVTSHPLIMAAVRMLGPDGGEVEHLVASDGATPVAYASRGRNLFVSHDLGQHWGRILSGTAQAITALTAKVQVGTVSYGAAVGTVDGRVTLVDGPTGSPVEHTGLAGAPVQDLRALPSSTLVAATPQGVFLDTGSGWTAKNSGLTDLDVRSVFVDPASGAILVGTGTGKVFRSEDGAVSWVQLGGALGGPVTSVHDCTGGPLLAGTSSGGLFVSSDNGSTWVHDDALASVDVRDEICAFAVGQYVVVTGDEGPVYGGQSGYQALGTGLPTLHAQGMAQIILDPDSMPPSSVTDLLATDVGVFRADLQGLSTPWVPANSGLLTSTVRSVATDPINGAIYAGTSLGLEKSTDQGLTWALEAGGLTSRDIRALAVDPVQPQTLYALTYDQGAFKSTDGAATWSAVNTGLSATDLVAVAIDPADPSTLYAGSATAGMFKSTDGAATWSAIDNGLTTEAVTSIHLDGSRVLVTTAGGGVFVSLDGGASWQSSNTGLASLSTTTLVRQGDTLFVGTTDAGVFSSADNGATWVARGTITAPVHALLVDPTNPTYVIAATSGGLWTSDDGGASWQGAGNGLLDPDVLALAGMPQTPTGPATLFIGTSSAGVGRSFSGGR